jgi:hypothetical protein
MFHYPVGKTLLLDRAGNRLPPALVFVFPVLLFILRLTLSRLGRALLLLPGKLPLSVAFEHRLNVFL